MNYVCYNLWNSYLQRNINITPVQYVEKGTKSFRVLIIYYAL